MDALERFPLRFMTPEATMLRKVSAIMAGPGALAAPPQTVQNGAGRWGISYKTIRIATTQQRLVARAFLSRMTSPLRPMYVSPLEWLTSPRRLAKMPQIDTTVPFSDGARFSDGTPFEGMAHDFIVSADAAYFAQTLYVTPLVPVLRLQGGQFIELAGRLYLIEQSFDDDSVVEGGQRLQIWPPLRAAATAGDVIEAENPHVRMRLDVQSAEVATEMVAARYAYFDLAFVEDDWTI